MKYLRLILVALIVLTVVFVPVLALADTTQDSEAAEGPSTARKVWDTIWRFINFGIMVYVLVRFARKPLMKFLGKHSEDIKENLDHYKNLLAEADAEYQKAENKLAQLEKLIQEVKEYMHNDALRTKQSLLDEAEARSKEIIADAKERADKMLQAARDEVKAELVELAWNEAEKLIREKIAPEDHHRLINEYVIQLKEVEQAG